MPHLLLDAVAAARLLICVFLVGAIHGGSPLAIDGTKPRRQDRHIPPDRSMVSVPVWDPNSNVDEETLAHRKYKWTQKLVENQKKSAVEISNL